jgi:hypothetical protein
MEAADIHTAARRFFLKSNIRDIHLEGTAWQLREDCWRKDEAQAQCETQESHNAPCGWVGDRRRQSGTHRSARGFSLSNPYAMQ